MAELIFHGAGCFEIKTKKANAVIDPVPSTYGSSVELKDKSVVLADKTQQIGNANTKFIVNNPGEYEISNLSFQGISAQKNIDDESTLDGIIYRIVAGEVVIGFLGNINPKLSDEQLEQLGMVDLLIVPVGGNGLSPDAISAASLVREIEPKLVILSHFQSDKISYPMPQDDTDLFAKEFGQEIIAQPKIKLTRISIPEDIQVIQLEEV